MDYKAYALMAIILASFVTVGGATNMAFAQNTITVKTDKAEYKTGDTVMISGTVGTVKPGLPVVIQVFNPAGAAYRVDQANVNADKTFTYPLVIGGKLGITGEYKVKVTYDKQSSETTFKFVSSEKPPTQGAWQTYNLKIGDKSFKIPYTIQGGKLNNITANPGTATLQVFINSTADGTLTVALPRNVIDAKDANGTKDTDFTVEADGAQAMQVDEKPTNATTRVLAIGFENGTEEIDIIGTQVVPEFGTIAAIVLAVSIVSIIAVSARSQNRFSFLPKN